MHFGIALQFEIAPKVLVPNQLRSLGYVRYVPGDASDLVIGKLEDRVAEDSFEECRLRARDLLHRKNRGRQLRVNVPLRPCLPGPVLP